MICHNLRFRDHEGWNHDEGKREEKASAKQHGDKYSEWMGVQGLNNGREREVRCFLRGDLNNVVLGQAVRVAGLELRLRRLLTRTWRRGCERYTKKMGE